MFERVREMRRFAKEEAALAKKGWSGGDTLEVLTGYKHSSLRNAVLADVFDVIPVVGDASNIVRAARLYSDLDGFKTGQERRQIRFEAIIDAESLRDVLGAVRASIDELSEEARKYRKHRGGLQGVDAALGVIPGAGVIADLIPTNTIAYLSTHGGK